MPRNEVPNFRTEQRGRKYYLIFWWHGRRHCFQAPGEGTKKDAQHLQAKVIVACLDKKFDGTKWSATGEEPPVESARRKQPKDGIRFSDFVDEWIAHASAGSKAPEAYAHLAEPIRRAWRWKRLEEISAQDVDRFIKERRSSCRRSTANKTVVYLRDMMRTAVRWGYISTDPAEHLTREPGESTRHFPISLDTAEKVLLPQFRESEQWCADLVRVGFGTAARQDELLSLRVQDVNLEQRLVTFRSTKNGTTRTVPFRRRLLPILERLTQGKDGSRFVFEREPGNKITRGSIRHPFERAVRAAGLTRTVKDERGTERIEMFRFHDIRHSAATELARERMPLTYLKKQLGHSSLAMVNKYADPAAEDVARMVAELDEEAEKRLQEPETATSTATS